MEAPAATDPEADVGLGVAVGLVPLATPAWASEVLLLAELSEDPEVEAVSPSKIVLTLPEGNGHSDVVFWNAMREICLARRVE